MLHRLCLKLAVTRNFYYKGHMDEKDIFASLLVSNLTDAFKKSLTFNIAYRSAYFTDDHIRCRFSGGGFFLGQSIDACFDFFSNVRDYLNCCSKIVAAALSGKYIPVNFTGTDAAAACQIFIYKSLVMAQIQIGFSPVFGDENFTMLVWTHGAGVYIEVRVKFLEQNPKTTLFQQSAQRGGANAFSQTGHNSTGDKDVFCHNVYLPFIR